MRLPFLSFQQRALSAMPICVVKLAYSAGLRHRLMYPPDTTIATLKNDLSQSFYTLFNHHLVPPEDDFVLIPLWEDIAPLPRPNEEMEGLPINNRTLEEIFPHQNLIYMYAKVISQPPLPPPSSPSPISLPPLLPPASPASIINDEPIVHLPMCCICLVNTVSVAFLPCNHVKTCPRCGLDNRIDSCPICRQEIHSKHVLFF